MPQINNNQGKGLSQILADEYEWESFLSENAELNELFSEPPLDDYDKFLTTLDENGYDYDPDWDEYRTTSLLTSEASDHLKKHGLTPSNIPQVQTQPDLSSTVLNPFQNSLTDDDLDWILADSSTFYDYVVAQQLELAFLDDKNDLIEVPESATAFYETLARFYDFEGNALQDAVADVTRYDVPEEMQELYDEYQKAVKGNDKDRAIKAAVQFQSVMHDEALALASDAIAVYAENGWLSSSDLGKLSRYVSGFETRADDTSGVVFTPEFEMLAAAEQAAVLKELDRIGKTGMYRDKLAQTDEPHFKTYYQAHLDLIAGNMPSAQLKLTEFKTWAKNSDDPEITVMREEARVLLKQMTLSLFDELAAASEELLTQRLSHLGWDSYNKGSNMRSREMLGYLGEFVRSGKADTLDEAVAVLKNENERLCSQFRKNAVVPKNWIVRYPLEKMTPEELDKRERAGVAFSEKFARDGDPSPPPEVPVVGLQGGTLDHFSDAGTLFATQTFVVIGNEGGTIVTAMGEYIFPPSAQMRTVMLSFDTMIHPGLNAGQDYKFRPTAHYDPNALRSDYENGHPNSLFSATMQWNNLSLTDPDMASLCKLGSRASLIKRATEDGERRELLTQAKTLHHRNGSYTLAGKYLEQVFAVALEDAITALPQERIATINAQVKAEKAEIEKEVRQHLEEQKAANPEIFETNFTNGQPSAADIAMMVQAAMTQKAFGMMRQEAFRTLNGWAQNGSLNSDPLAKEAWEIYNDMLDPLDQTWNWSSATWDAVLDEVVITALTLPFVMAGGAAVRTALLARSFTLRLAAQGGFRALAARGLIAGAGIATEASLQTVGTGLITGHGVSAQDFGFNLLMLTAFHSGGSAWSKAATKAGIGEEAIMAAGGLSRYGKMSLNFTGTIGTQTMVATGMTYATDILTGSENPETFMQRFGEEGLRMLAYHYGGMAMNKATGGKISAAEKRADLRFEVAKREGARKDTTVDSAVDNAHTLVPKETPRATGTARAVSIEEAQLFASRWAEIQGEIGHSYYKSVLRESLNGMVIADTNFKGSEAARTIDHHGDYATPDNKNATMKMLDLFEEALARTEGDVDAAVKLLNITSVTTDNLADGMWCIWIARNQQRVLRDPALRQSIRDATRFEDFTAFGSAYARGDPGVELQAALFGKYGEILGANGIKGSDRFPPSLAEKIMTEGHRVIDEMLANPAARKAAAEKFWGEVDAATRVAKEKAIMPESVDGQVNFYDTKALSEYGTLAQWLAIPQAHDLNLQVSVAPMPPAKSSDGTVIADRRLTIVAIPDGRALPSGKGLLSIKDTLNAAEKAKAESLGLTPNFWFGKDNVILPNPAGGGTLLTPAELAKILTDPANGLFEAKVDASIPSAAPEGSAFPDLTRPPNAPRYNLETGEFYDSPELTEMGPNAHYDEVPLLKPESKPTSEATGPMPTKPRSPIDTTPLSERMWSTFAELHALIEGNNGKALTDAEHTEFMGKLQSYWSMIDALSAKGHDVSSLRSDWIILQNEIAKYDPTTAVTESMPKRGSGKQPEPVKGVSLPTPTQDAIGDLIPPNRKGKTDFITHYKNFNKSPFIGLAGDGTVINGNGQRVNLALLQHSINSGILPNVKILNHAEMIEMIQAKLQVIEEKLMLPHDRATQKDLQQAKYGWLQLIKSLGADAIFIEGIIPAECLKEGTRLSESEIRAMRLRSLQRDPENNHRIEKKSAREGEIGLELEEAGLLPGPIQRDISGGSEFIDAQGTKWDIKKFYSDIPGSQGAFEIEKTRTNLASGIVKGENIILDCAELTLVEQQALSQIVEAEGWSDRIIWYPAKPE